MKTTMAAILLVPRSSNESDIASGWTKNIPEITPNSIPIMITSTICGHKTPADAHVLHRTTPPSYSTGF